MSGRLLSVVLMALTACGSVATAQDGASLESAQTAEPGRTITVTGTATRTVKPDRVFLRFAVWGYDAELEKAKAQCDETAGRLMTMLAESGVEEKHIQLVGVTSRAERERVRPEPGEMPSIPSLVGGKIRGYQVSHGYAVELQDVKLFSTVTDALVSEKQVMMLGHEFRSSAAGAIERDLLVDAIREATLRAERMAHAVGAKLTQAIRVEDRTSPSDFRFAVDRGRAVSLGGGEREAPVGEITMSALVEVTFEMGDPAK
jgi:uncharacterized protein YggE